MNPPATNRTANETPFVAVIGGSGLGARLARPGFLNGTESVRPETPFGLPSGDILVGRLGADDGACRIALLSRHGDGHLLNPHEVPYRANIFALKMLGVTHIVASGATGSLREHIHPGEIVLVDQFIDRTHGRPRTFFDRAAVHVEFADPCCPVTRRWLLDAAEAAGVTMHARGTYVCMEGPAFSTRAESEMHRQWGGDVIGMTALPEAKLAREAEMAYALLALPTDYDCWRTPSAEPGDSGMASLSLLEEIIGNLERAADASIRVLRSALGSVERLQQEASPSHNALRLGIWSDKARIEPNEVERLRPLWGRYFSEQRPEAQ